ncbi:hypothetical protein NQ314_007289 [Rhamnusium bicolor]|uniref:CCR4-NOT transcription complex subunit 4 n=1 Tax=Rhamnusium bicolor TaxID=1586634 RepID=A0AAV8YQM5_9CUCU|nr:hypothetical protein NQ314_007289 [Rhamnusium bicolor]
MSVLNQSGEEQVECPLCMEPLEVDDLNFFPCTCGYQICRFCWHRIRTDENGLCPACRKAYSENPADFIPLSQEQVAKLKAEKRQRDQQRKAKLSESRKHLASVRVVQRNLVFVVGLPMRLADAEVLKRHEYFGKFGKIHKVVINQSTSYAGSQGPSASAYVTYMKSDDALRAIESVNNITIDGRLIKSSLGTTKYCSHFMKNQTCPKPDCMYLHDFGDPEASFTKEQMHAGKHQEYEKKLHEGLLVRTATTNNTMSDSKPSAPLPTTNATSGSTKSSSKENVAALSSSVSSSSSTTSNTSNSTNKENWPQLNIEKDKKEKEKGKKNKTRSGGGDGASKKERKDGFCGGRNEARTERSKTEGWNHTIPFLSVKEENSTSPPLTEPICTPTPPMEPSLSLSKLPPIIDDNSSFFSLNSFHKISPSHPEDQTDTDHTDPDTTQPSTILTDTLPNINTTEDWAAAFGFPSTHGPTYRGHRGHDSGYSKGIENYNSGFYEMSKIQENIMDVLSNKTNGFGFKQDPQPSAHSIGNGVNGLDQNMSKFFMDFHKNNKDVTQPQFPNGFNGIHQNNYYSGAQSNAERIMLLQQKQLEEQLLNLSLKQGYGGGSSSVYQNGISPQHFVNGENGGFGNLHGQLYGNSNVKHNSRAVEDDLGFDPFQETQKAFAELMASEQSHKTHSTGRGSQINGVIHNQNGGHLPPPPPGFVQQNTHMNSFGSKILPFLNMSSSQQQINSSSQSNWPSSFNTQVQQHQQQQQQQQQKSINNTCNDWKVLDPAILSSSRHYPLANMPPIRDHYPNVTQLGTQQIQNGPPLRSYEYTNNAFSNFTQQLQPNFNNFSHLNSPQNLNWFSSDLNSQISSPPGFRNSQTTKQQEC